MDTWKRVAFLCFMLCIHSDYTFMLCLNETDTPTEWSIYEYPNPQVDIYKCGRCKKSWICDPNHILSEDRADKLDHKIEDIRTSGQCGCSNCTNGGNGYPISIAIVNRIKDPGSTDRQIESTAKHFAKYLREKWNNGTCLDNIVILLSRGDRKIFTNVGSKTEVILNYDCLECIYKDAKPELSKGNYANALDFMIKQYKETLNTGVCSINTDSQYHPVWIAHVILAIFGCIFIISCIGSVLTACCGGSRSGHGGGGGRGGGGWGGGGGSGGCGGGDGGGGF